MNVSVAGFVGRRQYVTANYGLPTVLRRSTCPIFAVGGRAVNNLYLVGLVSEKPTPESRRSPVLLVLLLLPPPPPPSVVVSVAAVGSDRPTSPSPPASQRWSTSSRNCQSTSSSRPGLLSPLCVDRCSARRPRTNKTAGSNSREVTYSAPCR